MPMGGQKKIKMDNIIDSWNRYPNDLKEKIALTSAKVMHAYKNKEKQKKNGKEGIPKVKGTEGIPLFLAVKTEIGGVILLIQSFFQKKWF